MEDTPLMKRIKKLLPKSSLAENSKVPDTKPKADCEKGIGGKGCISKESLNQINIKRKWKRANGDEVIFKAQDVKPLKIRNKWGRYLSYKYSVGGIINNVEADCKDYTANWLNDNLVFNKNKGWNKLSNSRSL